MVAVIDPKTVAVRVTLRCGVNVNVFVGSGEVVPVPERVLTVENVFVYESVMDSVKETVTDVVVVPVLSNVKVDVSDVVRVAVDDAENVRVTSFVKDVVSEADCVNVAVVSAVADQDALLVRVFVSS
jgi:hypothetical protein